MAAQIAGKVRCTYAEPDGREISDALCGEKVS